MATEAYSNINYNKLTAVKRELLFHGQTINGIKFPNTEKLSPEEKNNLGLQISKYSNSCGCETGATIALSTTTIYIFLTYFSLISLHSNPTVNYLISFAVFGVSAIFGKIIGLQVARIKLIRLSNKLLSRLILEKLKNPEEKPNR